MTGSKAAWRCKVCHESLGEVRGGTLYPTAPVERVERNGVVVVRCGCGELRTYVPSLVASELH